MCQTEGLVRRKIIGTSALTVWGGVGGDAQAGCAL